MLRAFMQEGKPTRIYYTPHRLRAEKRAFAAIHAASLVDAAVFVVTLGRYESHFRFAVYTALDNFDCFD